MKLSLWNVKEHARVTWLVSSRFRIKSIYPWPEPTLLSPCHPAWKNTATLILPTPPPLTYLEEMLSLAEVMSLPGRTSAFPRKQGLFDSCLPEKEACSTLDLFIFRSMTPCCLPFHSFLAPSAAEAPLMFPAIRFSGGPCYTHVFLQFFSFQNIFIKSKPSF